MCFFYSKITLGTGLSEVSSRSENIMLRRKGLGYIFEQSLLGNEEYSIKQEIKEIDSFYEKLRDAQKSPYPRGPENLVDTVGYWEEIFKNNNVEVITKNKFKLILLLITV